MLTALTVSASFFTAAAVTHLLVCVLTGGNRFLLKSLPLGLIFLAVMAAFEYRAGAVNIVSLYLAATLWLAYLMFFINLLNSVTLKMLARLAEAPGGAMDEAGFRAVFNEETGVKARLEDMRANGFIKLEGENLGLTGKAAPVLKAVFLIRKLLSIDAVG